MIVVPADGRGLPDFARLFADRSDANLDEGWVLSARTAYALWAVAETLFEQATADARSDARPIDPTADTEWQLIHRYPAITWGQDQLWRKYAAMAFCDIAKDLAVGARPMPQSAAEEMALWLTVEEAETWHDLAPFDEQIAELPQHPDDWSWNDCREYLFHDHDILLLFDASLTGVEDPKNPMSEIVPGITDYRPDSWFDPMWGREERHPGKPTYHQASAQQRG